MGESRKIKIAFATDGIFPHAIGGIQRHSALLIQALDKYQDLDIHVIHPHALKVFENLQHVTEYRIQNIDVKKRYIGECYQYSARVDEVIKKIKPDLIYAQGITVWQNVERYKNILINNPHGLESFQAIGFKERLIGFLFKRIQRKIFRNSRFVASEGGKLTHILEHEGLNNKIVFLPNAVDFPNEKKLVYKKEKEPINVFFMARFVKNKGIHILFECIEKLNGAGYENEFRFVLGGKGPLYEYYKQNNKFKNVDLKGFLTDEELKQNYLDSDVFVLPTLFEGMPTVVLEAMALGIPVIVSDVGGTSELINRDTGYLIERNNVTALYEAMLSFYKADAREKERKGTNARLKVQNGFTWEKLAEKHHDLFSEIIEGNSQ
jgi:glycosyltransferase involved in cell wall biosynthesis